jgi:hypothetical protein
MHAVRRVLATAGLAGLLLTAVGAPAWADPTPTADPSATTSPPATPDATASPDATPSADATASPDDGQPPTGTTDCGQTQGSTDGTPGLDPGVICQAGGINPGTAPSPTVDCGQVGAGGAPASPPPPGTVCIASGLNPGTTAGSGAPRLPRTGPAPLRSTLAVAGWLLLLGLLATIAGRRRTASL